jgi:hypothetical protein
MTGRKCWHLLKCLLVGALMGVSSAPGSAAFAQNGLEKAIAAAQPCKTLKVEQKVLGVNVELGIDRLDFIRIEKVDIQVNGDVATANALGTLACRTSDSAPFHGGFSARAHVQLQANLSTCVMGKSSIDIVETGGELGDVVEALRPEISHAVLNGLERALKKLCAG